MVVAPAQFLMAPPLQVIWLRAAQRILAEGTFEGDRSFLGPQLAQWNVKAICCWVGISLSFRLFARELPNCWDVLVVNSGCASKRLSPGSHLRLPQFLVCWLWRFLHFKIICGFVLVCACVGICMLALALSQLISISKWLSFLILVRAVGQLSCCEQQKKTATNEIMHVECWKNLYLLLHWKIMWNYLKLKEMFKLLFVTDVEIYFLDYVLTTRTTLYSPVDIFPPKTGFLFTVMSYWAYVDIYWPDVAIKSSILVTNLQANFVIWFGNQKFASKGFVQNSYITILHIGSLKSLYWVYKSNTRKNALRASLIHLHILSNIWGGKSTGCFKILILV